MKDNWQSSTRTPSGRLTTELIPSNCWPCTTSGKEPTTLRCAWGCPCGLGRRRPLPPTPPPPPWTLRAPRKPPRGSSFSSSSTSKPSITRPATACRPSAAAAAAAGQGRRPAAKSEGSVAAAHHRATSGTAGTKTLTMRQGGAFSCNSTRGVNNKRGTAGDTRSSSESDILIPGAAVVVVVSAATLRTLCAATSSAAATPQKAKQTGSSSGLSPKSCGRSSLRCCGSAHERPDGGCRRCRSTSSEPALLSAV
mmetsp:Transcript_18127/g.50350  ORF Transcript_18127/g.50350 Transcript_18127/m.50350 type:complete len:252 (-) Transcript_18127:255-1010(-)